MTIYMGRDIFDTIRTVRAKKTVKKLENNLSQRAKAYLEKIDESENFGEMTSSMYESINSQLN